MSSRAAEPRNAFGIRFSGGPASPSQRELVAASLVLCPGAKHVGDRDRR